MTDSSAAEHARSLVPMDVDLTSLMSIRATVYGEVSRCVGRNWSRPARDGSPTSPNIELPPSDADILISIARATRTNLKLCGKK